MFRTKLTLASLALAATIGAAAPLAQANPARHTHDYSNAQPSPVGHDPWYRYAVSFTQRETPAAVHDDWYRYAISLAKQLESQQTAPFITDTLAPGGKPAPAQGYRFITDTLAPGGGTSEVSAPAPSRSDFTDAGIGAGAMAGLALVLLASGRMLQQHRRRLAAA